MKRSPVIVLAAIASISLLAIGVFKPDLFGFPLIALVLISVAAVAALYFLYGSAPGFKMPRMAVTLAVAIFLTLVIGAVKPDLLPVTLYKLSLITIAGVAGYYLDRECFPYARPDQLLQLHQREPGRGWYVVYAGAQIRRAVVVAAVVIAVGLGA